MRTQRPARAVSDFRYSPLVAALSLAFGGTAAHAGNTFTVSVPGDRLVGFPTTPNTLRDAIEFFNIASVDNCSGSGDKIKFLFSNGPFVVDVSDALPFITCSGLTIDGAGPNPGDRAILTGGNQFINNGLYSQSGAPVNVINMEVDSFSYGVALGGNLNAGNNVLTGNSSGFDPGFNSGVGASGNVLQGNSLGMRIVGSGVTIDSNQISGSGSDGIYVSGNNISITRNTISSNTTGIYVSYGGSTVVIDGNAITENNNALSASAKGIYLEGSSAVVNNNLISGNDYAIYLHVDFGTQITNNRIGTTDDGLQPYISDITGNGHGIVFNWPGFGSLNHNTQITGNTISGNQDYGIDLSDFTNVRIAGNNIGVRMDGALPGIGNSSGGILAACGSGIEITGNVISGNTGSGIEFDGVQGGGRVNISGNKIGVMGDGVTALGNSAYGVALRFGGCVSSPAGGTSNLVINGDNVIANNSADGVLVSQGTGNTIVENSIHDNGEKNLNLGSPGLLPRPNDPPLDTDGGPNNGQDYPVLSAATRDWPNGRTLLAYSLSGPAGDYRIDAYSNDSGSPGGKVWLGTKTITVPAGNTASDTFQVDGLAVSNRPNNFSLTATALASNDTSEFSPTAFINPVPAVTVTPNPPNLDFGQVAINTVSPVRTITLRSSGNEPYRIGRMRLGSCFGPAIYGGPFMIASTCVPNVDYAPGASCAITGRFAPLALGTQSVAIAICDNSGIDASPSRTFNMTGVGGTPPPISIVPSEFDFGSVLAGSKSPPQEFAISNPSGSVISIGPVTVSNGDFVIDSSTCGTSLDSGALCVAMVRFAPSQPQASDAILSVAGTAPALPASAPAVKVRKVSSSSAGSATAHLTGLGIQVADIQLPASIDFGTYTVGTAPIRQNVEIVNSGNAIVSFSNLSATAPFVLTNNCPLNIAPGERCTVSLDFSTGTVGDYTGVLSVVSNAIGGTRAIPLTAHAVAVPQVLLSVSPNSVSFGDRLLGTTSATQRVTVKNIGNLPAVITSIVASADFVLSNNSCTVALAPSQTCFADVALRPVGFGPRTGSLFINSNATGSPNVVGLGGTGCRPFSTSSSRFGMGSGFNCAP